MKGQLIRACSVTLILLVAASPEAFAQETGRAEVQSRGPDGTTITLGVQGRVSVPGGTVDSSIPADYCDLFKTGFGASLEGTLLWRVSPKWRLGPYLSVGLDSYDGKGDTDDFGVTLKPDSMEVTSFLVGARALLDLGPSVQLDLHMAFGAAHYGKVDGVLSGAGAPLEVGVFKSSTAFAFDFGSRLVADAGPVFFDAGIGLRTQGAPGNADFAFDSGPLVNFELEFGVGIRF
ncbi:MAG TPA: hypothetical protein VE981_15795 [Planctomycetota bacterium]|nr:hypothetical protein [Planctomycetota bacterium]